VFTPLVAQPAQFGALPAIGELSGVVRGVIAFLLVLATEALLLSRRAAVVDRAIDRTANGSPSAVVYGVIAFGLVAFLGGYLFTQAGRLGVGGDAVRLAGGLLVGGAVLTLGSFGYLVVGTYLTEIESVRRPWVGAVIGASLSAVPWIVLSTLSALSVWVVVAAVGVGEETRNWVHGERTVESEVAERR
jgi:hypothetical protein